MEIPPASAIRSKSYGPSELDGLCVHARRSQRRAWNDRLLLFLFFLLLSRCRFTSSVQIALQDINFTGHYELILPSALVSNLSSKIKKSTLFEWLMLSRRVPSGINVQEDLSPLLRGFCLKLGFPGPQTPRQTRRPQACADLHMPHADTRRPYGASTTASGSQLPSLSRPSWVAATHLSLVGALFFSLSPSS